MISRRTTRALSESIEEIFWKPRRGALGDTYIVVDTDSLYDFLFDNDYSASFCNQARDTYASIGTRRLKDFIMKLHTGETLEPATLDWDEKQRQRLAQRYIRDLAEDILQKPLSDGIRTDDPILELLSSLKRNLELDGYAYKDSRLIEPEEDVLDIVEEEGILTSLFAELSLGNQATSFHHLGLSEEHYVAERWDDSISNSRKFLESILREVASKYHFNLCGSFLEEDFLSKPAKVRAFLADKGLLEIKEKEAIAIVYSLLSETGGHPYMAESDQARLLRQLSLTFSQFVMLRLKGSVEKS